MSGDLIMGQFVLDKYAKLNEFLRMLIQACEMESGPERASLVASLREQTNHSGIHCTKAELTLLFLGRELIESA